MQRPGEPCPEAGREVSKDPNEDMGSSARLYFCLPSGSNLPCLSQAQLRSEVDTLVSIPKAGVNGRLQQLDNHVERQAGPVGVPSRQKVGQGGRKE